MRKKGGLRDFYSKLDRSFFIDSDYKGYAEFDTALPIGYSQTISQPSLVYEMTETLQTDENCRVLEIGTGSGYQTVLLAEFSGEVYTVEFIPELAEKARKRLDQLGYTNIRFIVGDGSQGWPEFAPFDRIMVTAASSSIPDPLIDQMAAGGRMIIPVGPQGSQKLMLITKDKEERISRQVIGDVTFVELKGKYGWGRSDD